MRVFPNMTVMAPGDEADLEAMVPFALSQNGPTSIRYPKAKAVRVDRAATPIEAGRAEVIEWGDDGMIVACGTLLADCVRAAQLLRAEGLDVGVINARFVKPLDTETILRAVSHCGAVVTVEEGRSPADSAVPCSKPPVRPVSKRRDSVALALATTSSSMANGTNCWRRWG